MLGEDLAVIPDWLQTPVDDLIHHLDISVWLKVRDIPQDMYVVPWHLS